MSSFIHLFNKMLLKADSILDTVLRAKKMLLKCQGLDFLYRHSEKMSTHGLGGLGKKREQGNEQG